MGRSERTAAACAVAVLALALPAVASAAWLPAEQIGTLPDMQDVHLGMDSNGFTIIGWQNPDDVIKVRNRSSIGTFSVPQTVAAASAQGFAMAVSPDRAVVFAWLKSDGTHTRVNAVIRADDGSLGPVRSMSPSGRDASGPRVGIADNGDALVGWTRSDGTHD